MIKIPLTQGKIAFIDDDDYDLVSKYKWCAHKKGNSFRAVTTINGKQIKMHRLIMEAQSEQQIDHINGNQSDNTKNNLRFSSQSENCMNRHKIQGKSRHKGIYWETRAKKWRSRIYFNGKRFHLGCFDSEIEAAKAYDKKAKELFGEFAHINFKEY